MFVLHQARGEDNSSPEHICSDKFIEQEVHASSADLLFVLLVGASGRVERAVLVKRSVMWADCTKQERHLALVCVH